MEKFKAGFVAIIGLPNAGKSTLLNLLIETKLAPVSSKPQMTRKSVIGILNGENYQCVFVDSPGIIDPAYLLQEYMMKDIRRNIADADILIVVVDISNIYKNRNLLLEKINPIVNNFKNKVIFVLNKTDVVKQDKIIENLKWVSDNFKFDEIFPLSCRREQNVKELKDIIVKFLPENEPYYDEDLVGIQNVRFFVKEYILESIYQYLQKELPYSCLIGIEEYKEHENRKDYIRALIYVERESHKHIIIGKKGEMLKKIGKSSREKIENMIGKGVYLELYVKVLENWKDRKDIIKNVYKEE